MGPRLICRGNVGGFPGVGRAMWRFNGAAADLPRKSRNLMLGLFALKSFNGAAADLPRKSANR